MKNKIKITEKQLKMLKEQNDEFSSLSKSVGDFMKEMGGENFETSEQLIKSISQRLANAITLKEWYLVKEVFDDVYKFEKEKLTSKEEQPSIGNQSSVLDDTDEKNYERNYGIEESIKKIKSEFKRFL